MKKALLNNNCLDYNQFIYIIYYGLELKILKDINDIYLYRVTYIDQKTYDKIINSCGRLVVTRTFLSFTKNKDIAIRFMHLSKPNVRIILFVVKPLKGNKNMTVTNVDASEISFFYAEEEVLFLPFSGFEISEIKKENDKYTTIYLNYLNKYEKKVKDYIKARSKDKVETFLKELIKKSKDSIFKHIITEESIKLIQDYGNKKNVLWIDQYARCKVYNDYILKYSQNLNNFYFERVTTIREAFSVLSNYEFKFIYIIINDKLSENFFSQFEKEIKQLGLVTANIIFYEEKPKLKNKYINDLFFNPGKIVTDFSKVVDYLNMDECEFNKILKFKKTIDSSFAGNSYGNIFKEINEKQIVNPLTMINKITCNLPNQESISKFKNFVYKYGNNLLSKVVNPSLEKK